MWRCLLPASRAFSPAWHSFFGQRRARSVPRGAGCQSSAAMAAATRSRADPPNAAIADSSANALT